ncbi:MAG: hypothetical protein LBT87_00230, partial [Treponema sp.]|nr:hypothetical protein [Treponema sp.]
LVVAQPETSINASITAGKKVFRNFISNLLCLFSIITINYTMINLSPSESPRPALRLASRFTSRLKKRANIRVV